MRVLVSIKKDKLLINATACIDLKNTMLCKEVRSKRSTQSIIIFIFSAAAAKSLQLCPTLYDPIDGSPPGSPIPGILQARTLEWVAISFSNEWKWKVKVKLLSGVGLLATPWTAAHQAPPSMGFSRQEYFSGLPLPSPHSIPRSVLKSLSFPFNG